MPNATTSARFESGRAISGRIGISFASTVSSVIDVPATHSSGVNLIWPDWTEAISSSVDAKSRPPASGDVRLVRLGEDTRHEWHRRDDHSDDEPTGRDGPTGCAEPERQRDPETAR